MSLGKLYAFLAMNALASYGFAPNAFEKAGHTYEISLSTPKTICEGFPS